MSTTLAPCPDCGTMISPRAEDCPHCGAPLAEDVTAARILWVCARVALDGVALFVGGLCVFAILGAWLG